MIETVLIELTDLPKSVWAIAHPAHPSPTSLELPKSWVPRALLLSNRNLVALGRRVSMKVQEKQISTLQICAMELQWKCI